MRTLFFVTLLLGVVAFIDSAYPATSGTLTLRGTVATVYSLTVVPDGSNNTSLNITGGETNRSVADVTETSNNLLGYKIKVASSSGGFLVNTSDNTKKTSYQLGYNGGSPVSLSVAGNYLKTVSSLSSLTTATSNARVNVTAYPLAPAGNYEDTVTLTIEAP